MDEGNDTHGALPVSQYEGSYVGFKLGSVMTSEPLDVPQDFKAFLNTVMPKNHNLYIFPPREGPSTVTVLDDNNSEESVSKPHSASENSNASGNSAESVAEPSGAFYNSSDESRSIDDPYGESSGSDDGGQNNSSDDDPFAESSNSDDDEGNNSSGDSGVDSRSSVISSESDICSTGSN